MPRGDRDAAPHAAFYPVFSGDGYAAGYYSYLWSEVLDADAFMAFEEAGDDSIRSATAPLHEFCIPQALRDPADAYVAFRGRMPTTEALLAKRGLKRCRCRVIGKSRREPSPVLVARIG